MHYTHLKNICSFALASVLVFNTFTIPVILADDSTTGSFTMTTLASNLPESTAVSEALATVMLETLAESAREDFSTTEISATDIINKVNVADFASECKETSKKKKTIDEIPLYYQDDYKDTPFGHGTVATSGCGITCLAMVATYLLDEEFFPDELAIAYNDKGTYNAERMEYGSQDLGLPFVEKVFYFDSLLKHLEEGRVAIALMTGDSEFTDAGHFIVLAGLTEDGRIIVKDPYSPNYQNPKLKDGFKNGFDNSEIYVGLSGAWVYEKGYVPEPQMESLDIVFPTVK